MNTKQYSKVNEDPLYEKIYKKFGKNLPWCLEDIPGFFKDIIESKSVNPCKVIDLGCGVGDYANYLSEKGFQVTAIDISKTAIEIATRRKDINKAIKFVVGDVFNLKSLGKFSFAYEISLLHNISPEKRESYIEEVDSILEKNGKFMICCFSDKDEHFKGKKKVYFEDLDNWVFPLSREELIGLLSKRFIVEEIKKVYFGREGQRQKERWLVLCRKDNQR